MFGGCAVGGLNELLQDVEVMIEPRRGVDAALLYEKLRESHTSSFNVFNGATEVRQQVDQYLRWVGDIERLLRPVLGGSDLDRIALTRRYWATLANPGYSRANVAAVHQEVFERQVLLDELVKAVDCERRRLATANPETYFIVADTNVYLHHPDELLRIDWRSQIEMGNRTFSTIRLVIPILVVDELDNNKRNDRTKTRAGATLKALYAAFGANPSAVWTISHPGEATGGVTAELLLDNPSHDRLGRADDELVDRALMLRDFVGDSLHFVSYDTGAALRARAAGLLAHRLPHERPAVSQ